MRVLVQPLPVVTEVGRTLDEVAFEHANGGAFLAQTEGAIGRGNIVLGVHQVAVHRIGGGRLRNEDDQGRAGAFGEGCVEGKQGRVRYGVPRDDIQVTCRAHRIAVSWLAIAGCDGDDAGNRLAGRRGRLAAIAGCRTPAAAHADHGEDDDAAELHGFLSAVHDGQQAESPAVSSRW
jgi:hypothetical protein